MNPFEKYIKGEDRILVNIGNYLKQQYPKVLWMHPVNEGKRTPFERYKAQITHIKSGVPDILIFNRTELWSGLFIELKYGKNKPTENQINFMNELSLIGWQGKVCYSFDEAKQLIDNYLK